jgi:hypothetical protein
MAGEGEASGPNAPTMLAEATEAVRKATEAVESTSRIIGEAVKSGRLPDGPLDRLASLTREAPFQFLAVVSARTLHH